MQPPAFLRGDPQRKPWQPKPVLRPRPRRASAISLCRIILAGQEAIPHRIASPIHQVQELPAAAGNSGKLTESDTSYGLRVVKSDETFRLTPPVIRGLSGGWLLAEEHAALSHHQILPSPGRGWGRAANLKKKIRHFNLKSDPTGGPRGSFSIASAQETLPLPRRNTRGPGEGECRISDGDC